MILLNILILLFFPFLLIGLINKTKAIWSGRKGASIFQPYYDFFKLLHKGEVISKNSSFVFILFPAIYFSTVFFAGLLLPIIDHKAAISFEGSFILFIYIMALGKFFMIIGALDTGSSFEGMGASRESFFTAIPEPAIFIILGALSVLNGTIVFEDIFNFSKNSELAILITALIIIVFFIVVLIEGCRVPIDDPNTHLELTMIHEVMILDNSGTSLGFIQYSSSMKMLVLLSFIFNFIIPYNLTLPVFILCYCGLFLVSALIIGTLESLIARFRIVRIPEVLMAVVTIAFMIMFIILLFSFGGKQ